MDGGVLAATHNDAGDDADPDRFAATPRGTIPLTDPAPHRSNGRVLDDKTSEPSTLAAPSSGGPGESRSGPHERRLDHPEHDGSPLDEPLHQHGQAASLREAPSSTWYGESSTDNDADRVVGIQEEPDTSAVAIMRRFWDSETAKGRIPTGAELSRAAGVPPSTGLGRRKRREWAADLPEQLKTTAGKSR
ncbi:hypothetical protein ACIODS_17990 [Micromonospora chalcea]|uniref:hypothetical protein n=1 Tax=Micromonospora chalcea TaxID=1874 RepID=UPI003809E344